MHKPSVTSVNGVELITYKTGLRILVKSVKDTPIINITALIRAGYAYDSVDKIGVSSILPKTFQTYVDDLSALSSISLDYTVRPDFVSVSLDTLKENRKELLHVLYDTLINPDIDRRIYTAIDDIRDSQKRGNENVRKVLRREYFSLLFPGHPYGYNPTGTRKTLRKIQPEHISEFHGNYYTPKNMVIAAVGDITSRNVVGILKERFGKWYKLHKDLPDLPPLPEHPKCNLVLKNDKDMEEAFILLGHRCPTFSDADFPVFRVINAILDSPTEFGLRYHLREIKGFSYSPFSDWYNLVQTGTFMCGFTCKPDKVSEALEITIDQIKKLRSVPVHDRVLKIATSHFKNREILRMEHESNIAFKLAFAELFGLDFDYRDNWNKKADDLTPEQVLQAAQKYLMVDKLQIIVGGDMEKIGELNISDLIK